MASLSEPPSDRDTNQAAEASEDAVTNFAAPNQTDDGAHEAPMGPLSKKKRAPVTNRRTGDPRKQSPRQVRLRTAEDITNEQTAEQLALRTWAAMVAKKVLSGMSALMDELIESHLLDDDDEEADEGWLDDHHKREKKFLDEAITDSLDKFPDFNAINDLPPNSDPDIAQAAKQLKSVLAKCAIGATEFKERFSSAQLERMVKRDLEIRFKEDPKYSTLVREDVPGSDIKKYGSRGRTSSKGTFVKAADYLGGGGLDALLTGGWMRVAKDRIDPVAWSHQYGLQRKSERQDWRHHFVITERNGKQSSFELPRDRLAGSGASAVRFLTKAGVHIVGRDGVQKALVQFLRFKPKREIVRMPRVGWAQVGSHWIFVRPDEVIAPADMPQASHTSYLLDTAATRHGLHLAGTAAEWATEVATPLRGNSNVALSFATFFAAPLLEFASETSGGNHIYGPSTIGKTMASAAGQSIYGWPLETGDNAFGVTWAGSEAGFDALALARTDLGLPLDEITLADRRTAEQIAYKLASGTKGPRATSAGHLRESAHASVLVLSTGEKSLVQFIGPNLQEGARKRLVDVPAEVVPGSAFETIPCEQIHVEGRRLFDAMKRQHGAVGRDWQRHLVDIGSDEIKTQLQQHRETFFALPEVTAVATKAHPQVRAVLNRFALYDAALRMAIAAGLLPWDDEEAHAGVVACMQRWVAQRGNIDTAGEVVRAARQVEADLVAGLNDRFIRIHKTPIGWAPATEADVIKQKTPKLFDGYAKPDRILVRPEAWRRYCNGFDPAEIARHFRQRNILIADDDGSKLSRSERVMGKAERFYNLKLPSLPQHSNTATPDSQTAKAPA
jgi:putative DNA primase/helicase